MVVRYKVPRRTARRMKRGSIYSHAVYHGKHKIPVKITWRGKVTMTRVGKKKFVRVRKQYVKVTRKPGRYVPKSWGKRKTVARKPRKVSNKTRARTYIRKRMAKRRYKTSSIGNRWRTK